MQFKNGTGKMIPLGFMPKKTPAQKIRDYLKLPTSEAFNKKQKENYGKRK